MRFVDAGRVAFEVVAGKGVGPSARAAADGYILAAGALALQERAVAQVPEERALPVDRGETLRAHIAGWQRQEAAGADVADMVDEGKAVAIIDTLHRHAHLALKRVAGAGDVRERRGAAAGASRRAGGCLGLPLVDDHAAVVHSGGRSDIERARLRRVVEPVERPLVLLGAHHVAGVAPAGRDEKEDAPHDRLVGSDEGRDLGQARDRVPGDRGSHLERNTGITYRLEDIERPLERTADAPEEVVRRGVGTVQADVDARHPGIPRAPDRLPRAAARRRRREGDAKTARGRPFDDVEAVVAHQRVAAGDDQDRTADVYKLIDHTERFLGRQLPPVAPRLGLGPAMNAREEGSASDLPSDGERRAGEIHGCKVGSRIRSSWAVACTRPVEGRGTHSAWFRLRERWRRGRRG